MWSADDLGIDSWNGVWFCGSSGMGFDKVFDPLK